MTLSRNGVPWPSTWQYREPSTRSEIQEIEWATAKEYFEQDIWRDRLEGLRKLRLPNTAMETAAEIGVNELFTRMETEGASYPPTDQQRKRWYERCGQEWHWSKSPNILKTDKIYDEEMRHALFWLLEIGQHKERIKSQVLLPSILGANPDDQGTHTVFFVWQTIYSVSELEKELPAPETGFVHTDRDNEDHTWLLSLLEDFI